MDIDFRGPMTEEVLKELQRRNEEKLKAAIEYLGEKWILHPNNAPKKKIDNESKSRKKWTGKGVV